MVLSVSGGWYRAIRKSLDYPLYDKSIQVWVEEMNEMRVNLCRSVVNNSIKCQNREIGGLARRGMEEAT
jgi:hypothetical protein